MDLIIAGFLDSFSLINILFIAFGVFLGILMGAIPGLNGPMAITLAIPITFYMPTVTAIAFLIGINKGGSFGGSISSILLNTPGSPEAAATCFDGYPLAKQGKGKKAIKMALFSSVFGDVFSNIVLILVAAPIAYYAIKLGPPEICSVIIFALTSIAVLESSNLIKGIMAAAFGMLISTVGLDPVTAMPRLTFDMYQLESGITIMVIGIGMLALSELIIQLEATCLGGAKPVAFEKTTNKADENISVQEFKQAVPTLFRSSTIGCIIGAIPGLGATVSSFLAYGLAKKTSKDPDSFGKGNLLGIAAPEAANNAVIGSNLIPLFTLGIPGNVTAAILVGAFIIHGIAPGPMMFQEHTRTIYGIYGSMLIGNVFNLLLGYMGLNFFVKVLSIPKKILFPALLYICIIGAYLSANNMFSIGLVLFFAIIGYLMKMLKFSYVTLIIGFVLGPLFELSLQQSLLMSSMNPLVFIERPFSLVFMVLSALTVSISFYKAFKNRKNPEKEEDDEKECMPTDLS